MKNLTVGDIVKCTNGTLLVGNENAICDNFSKDTRTIQKGDIYIGIKGQNFDGNIFWKEALDKGADAVIVQDVNFSKEEVQKYINKAIIKVDNTLNSLYEIAKYKRSLYNIPVVAVTGSVGKTSTKDLIASVLSKKYLTLKTEGNNNNNIGLPLTILKLREHESLVVEMGMNHLGEISLLTNIAKPTISVITNIGTSHIGNLGSQENILKAKLEILEGMSNPILVLNNDDKLLHNWYENNKEKYDLHPYGIENESDVHISDIKYSFNNSNFTCKYNNDEFDISIPVGGKHFVYNAMACIIIGKILGLSYEQISNGVQELELTEKRMDILNLKNNITVINDTYNASCESMKAGLEYLANNARNRKIAVLGDMLELGAFSKALHEQVGSYVANNNIDILFCLGNDAKYIASSAIQNGMNEKDVLFFEDKKQLIEKLKEILQLNDTVLVKASNGMRFFEIVDILKNI